MADDLEDLLKALSDPEPQPKPAEVFLSKKPKAEESDDNVLVLAKVPKRKTFPTCGICKCKLKPGESHWKHTDYEKIDWWWCVSCMTKIDVYQEKQNAK